MEKITTENCIQIVRDRFPKFLPYWETYVSSWGLNQGITIQIMPFSEYAEDVIKANDEPKIKEIFDFVELILCIGDVPVQNAITTSFLEYLLSKDPDEIKFIKFSKYLGENTANYCRAWDEFTGAKTEGLW